jgi:RNA polymerase sigma-70 factor (ECF subfamily)
VERVRAPQGAATGERTLVERARRGDHAAFAELVDRRLPATLRTAAAILGDEADARDAAQLAFIQAWTHLPGLADPDRFSAWFGRIVVNTCRSAVRRRQRRRVREIPATHIENLVHAGTLSVADHEARSAELDRLERALGRITPDERLLLALHYYEDLSLAEIAERLTTSPKTVKSRLYTARRALARAIEKEDAR